MSYCVPQNDQAIELCLRITAGITMLTLLKKELLCSLHLFCRKTIGRLIAAKQTA